MAYPYRGSQPTRDENQRSSYSSNPNRLSGGAIVNGNDSRTGLMRRFTTNALPTLSPIGQQRRMAAGEPQMVSLSNTPAGLAREAQGSFGYGFRYGMEYSAWDVEDMARCAREFAERMAYEPPFSEIYKNPKPARLRSEGSGATKCGWKAKSVGVIGNGRPVSSDGPKRNPLTADVQPSGMNRVPPILRFDNVARLRILANHENQSERKLRQIESLLEQQRSITAELEKFDDATRREVEDGLRHERAVSQMIAQSEPTTPPEYQDSVPSLNSRPNRYSTNSLTSPPGIANRSNRSSAHLTSPPPGTNRPYTATTASNLPSQSVPGSRRQSDDEDEGDFLYYDPGLHRSAANPNRNSMPITTYDRKRNGADLASNRGSFTNTSFLFDDDERPSALPNKSSTKTSPPDTKSYLKYTADGFPQLIRREDNGELTSSSFAALELASANAEQQVPDRSTATRHRISLPPSALSSNGHMAPLNSFLAGNNDAKAAANNRRSVEVNFTADTKRPALMASQPNGVPNGAHVSYSTNDIPTLKSIDGDNSGGVSLSPPSTQPSTLADSSVHELTIANLNRNNSISTANHSQRQSQEFTSPAQTQPNFDFYNSVQSGLQGNAAPFGPVVTQDSNPMHSVQASNMPYGQTQYYNAYGMQMLNNGLSNMNLGNGLGGSFGGQAPWANQIGGQAPGQVSPYQQIGYPGYQQYGQGSQAVAGAGRFGDSRGNNQGQQRKAHAEEMYNGINITDIPGQVYSLCKDQHGCRFLQRKLEERNDEDIQLIFAEVKPHFPELMIDPFGNYLCQRLLEYANDDQRSALVDSAVPAMSKIALNQHGTRALQRMIEYISTQDQTNMIIEALRNDVVQLIQDLNGNHVIQKCLNHLNPLDAQFIFDAVGANCVVVGTHRHGCCVLQRCVDHASGAQKGFMVNHIIANALPLVQDPFGNYVVQYILELAEPCFTEPLCQSFIGKMGFLSKQKFSSNVMEKCIRCAEPDTRAMLISELIAPHEIEKNIRDSFANYVIQTAMEFADAETKAVLIETIRPILPSIRHTPYGRRISQKIQEYDNGGIMGDTSPHSATPAQVNTSAMPYPSARGPQAGRSNRMGMVGAPAHWGVMGNMTNGTNGFGGAHATNGFGGNDMAAPAPQRGQAYNVLDGTQNFHNFQQNGQGFGGPGFHGRGQFF